MFGFAAILAISVAISGTRAEADFDGDGTTDVAMIVPRANGGREVVVTLHGAAKNVVVATVDEFAVLSLVPPSDVERFCRPLAGIVPECTVTASQGRRSGLAFKRLRQEVVGLALWNGTRFTIMMSTDLTQGDRSTAETAVPAPPLTAEGIASSVRKTVLDLTIGSTGRVETCSVAEGSGSSALDAQACSVAKSKATYTVDPGRGSAPYHRRLSISWSTRP